MNLWRTNFSEDSNLGLYGLASDNYCILGPKLNSGKIEKLKDTLEVKILQSRVENTILAGIFLVGNSDFLLIPSSMNKYERESLNKVPTKIIEIDSRYNALGNNILIGKDKIMVNPSYKKGTIKKIEKETGYEVLKYKIGGTGIVGANAVILKDTGLLNPNVPEEELKEIEKILKVRFDYGTVNFGSGFVRSGVIFNKNGLVIGDRSTGPEISRILEQFEKRSD